MKSNIKQLRSRGYIENKELIEYVNLSKEELLELMKSEVATKRTISAKLLKNFKEPMVLKTLISRLTVEKKLYTKIAISESVGCFGEEASKELIQYLGKVGNNQHRSLPNKKFNKKNYPLPRDIIARTICKLGKSAINTLRDFLYTGEYIQVLEAIDAIGYISYYEGDLESEEDIINMIDRYKEDELMVWKLIRALQSFGSERVQNLLKEYCNSEVKQHRWEAERSLEQIKEKINKIC